MNITADEVIELTRKLEKGDTSVETLERCREIIRESGIRAPFTLPDPKCEGCRPCPIELD